MSFPTAKFRYVPQIQDVPFIKDLPQDVIDLLVDRDRELEDYLTQTALSGTAGAPILVAASNASAAEKAAAAFKADGTNDEVEIQAALALAATNGKVVQLSDGTFNVVLSGTGNTFSIGTSKLVGRGMTQTKISRVSGTNSTAVFTIGNGGGVEGLTYDDTSSGNRVFRSVGTNMFFDDVRGTNSGIVWSDGGSSSTNVFLHNCVTLTLTSGSAPISTSAANFWFLDACRLEGNERVALDGSGSVFLTNCYISIASGTGAFTTSGTAYLVNCSINGPNNTFCVGINHGALLGCNIAGTGTTTGQATVQIGSNSVVANNYIFGAGNGIKLTTGSVASVVIKSNYFDGAGEMAISLIAGNSQNHTDISVTDNYIVNAGSKTTNTYDAINATTTGTGTILRLSITGNVIRKTGNTVKYGVSINGAGITSAYVWANDPKSAYGTAAIQDTGTTTYFLPDGQVFPGGSPTGTAGGALDGTYPNPGLAASVAGAGLAETSDVLSVNVDGVTIEINVDTLRVKAGGIGATELASTAVVAGTYGDSSHVGAFTVDADGRLTAASNLAIAGISPSGAAGGSLLGTYPNPALSNTGVAAASYGDGNFVATFTVTAEGRLTAAANVPINPSFTQALLLGGM